MTTCANCGAQFERWQPSCPFCGARNGPLPPVTAYPDRPPQPPRAIRPLATAVLVLLLLLVLVDLADIAEALDRRDIFARIDAGDRVDIDEADRSDVISGVLGTVYGSLFLATIVLWIVWSFRARYNAEAYQVDQRYARPWLVFGWLVPFLNLVRPKRVVDDLARASDPSLPIGYRDLELVARPALVGWWWAAWLLSLFADNLSFRLGGSDDAAGQVTAQTATVVTDVLDIAAATLAVLVVRLVTSRQQEKSRLYVERYWGPAPPQPVG